MSSKLGPESTIPDEIAAQDFVDIEKVVLAGSGPLELAGIRRALDIDLITTRTNCNALLESDPERWRKEVHTFLRIRDGSSFQRTAVVDTDRRFDIWQTWYHAGRPHGSRELRLAELIEESVQHKLGFYVVKLEFIMEMKAHTDRPKDQGDLQCYAQFLSDSN